MITITNFNDDQVFPLDCDIGISIGDVKALIEADSSIAAASQELWFNSAPLDDASRSLASYGIADGDLIILTKAQGSSQQARGASSSSQGPSSSLSEEEQLEQLRQQILTDPTTMAQARETHPHIVEAAQRSPQEFATVMREFSRQAYQAQLQRERAEAELAAADEFDVDAQRKIEEAIQQENVYRSFENAMEFNPESFGTVTMLYVQTEVNGHEVKAFVDSGAQATIMSPECAERCGILRLIDRRFAGIARGVGTAKILGRVHSAQIKLSNNLYLPCSFTIMEGKGVECLFGLDMLKRYQANIDLKANALVINGESLRFLDEHELPSSAKELGAPEEDEAEAASRSKADAVSSSGLGGQSASSSMAASKGPGFPGAGQILNPEPSSSNPRPSAPVSSAPSAASGSGPSTSAPAPTAAQPSSRTFPPEAIDSLVNLGASRVQAQALLEAAGGNVEVAAGLLFHGQ